MLPRGVGGSRLGGVDGRGARPLPRRACALERKPYPPASGAATSPSSSSSRPSSCSAACRDSGVGRRVSRDPRPTGLRRVRARHRRAVAGWRHRVLQRCSRVRVVASPGRRCLEPEWRGCSVRRDDVRCRRAGDQEGRRSALRPRPRDARIRPVGDSDRVHAARIAGVRSVLGGSGTGTRARPRARSRARRRRLRRHERVRQLSRLEPLPAERALGVAVPAARGTGRAGCDEALWRDARPRPQPCNMCAQPGMIAT